ncbi:MAG: hypothetical protein ACYDAG_13060 [Chloroflexota bacterium]
MAISGWRSFWIQDSVTAHLLDQPGHLLQSVSSQTDEMADYEIEFYEEPGGRKPVYDWITKELSTADRGSLGVAMREVLQKQGIDVCRTAFGKQMGDGLFEFRLRQHAEQILRLVGKDPKQTSSEEARPLLRVFCHAYGNKIILLLGGYDKGADPSPKRQNEEIRIARQRLAEFRRRQRTSG